jgi:hypothetical protein
LNLLYLFEISFYCLSFSLKIHLTNIKQLLNHMILLDLGTKFDSGPSNKWGCILAIIRRCYLTCFYIAYFCIFNYYLLWSLSITFYTITIAPRIIPPKIAFLKATLGPDLNAKSPPVNAPAVIWLKASYCFLILISEH